MNEPPDEVDPTVPEHLLSVLHGLAALILGAAVWSAMAAVFGVWSLPAAPGLGWLIAWACLYGGRRSDGFVRGAAWLLAPAEALLALVAFSAFSVTQSPPDSDQGLRSIGLAYARLFTEAPWFGSVAVLLELVGVWFALRERPSGRRTSRTAVGLPCVINGDRAAAPRSAREEVGSQVA